MPTLLFDRSTVELTSAEAGREARNELLVILSLADRLVIADALRPIAVGIAAGLVGSYWLAQWMSSFVGGVEATNPTNYIAVAGLLLTTAVIAAWIPASRAAGVDPTSVLRSP